MLTAPAVFDQAAEAPLVWLRPSPEEEPDQACCAHLLIVRQVGRGGLHLFSAGCSRRRTS
ncbi:hypothetical protein C1J01_38590 [Nonomuraea aridisoli]|uniref:Uncharacterized protein n=1 Tax=Nonomuraea aridisoli TaxID=2070368 RepID=A0A2W2DEA0_9ACTN|nr:hypothetical protein C1J01_38590 [Nonomuraea aridisoli]